MQSTIDKNVATPVLEKLTNGLYILTTRMKGEDMETRDKDYIAAGTVAWVTQNSFEPPMITVAVRRDSDLAETMAKSEQFALHLLGRDQEKMAKAFSEESDIDQANMTINGYDYHKGLSENLPILKNVPGYLECELVEMVNNSGDHILYVGKVVGGEIHDAQAQPLHEWQSGLHYGG